MCGVCFIHNYRGQTRTSQPTLFSRDRVHSGVWSLELGSTPPVEWLQDTLQPWLFMWVLDIREGPKNRGYLI